MFKATQSNLPADVAIFSAAVSDFKIKEQKKEKVVDKLLYYVIMIIQTKRSIQ